MEKNGAVPRLTTKRLVTDAMLIAMYVALSLLSINLGNMKITLDALPIIVGAALFGPVDGLLIGLLGSFMNQLLTYGLTATTLLWIMPAAVRGLLVGWYAKKKDFALTGRQIVLIVCVSALVVTTLNTGVMYVDSKLYGYYSYAYVFGALAIRYLAGILTAAALSAITPFLLRVIRARVPAGGQPKEKLL